MYGFQNCTKKITHKSACEIPVPIMQYHVPTVDLRETKKNNMDNK